MRFASEEVVGAGCLIQTQLEIQLLWALCVFLFNQDALLGRFHACTAAGE